MSRHLIPFKVEPVGPLQQRASSDHPLATYVQLLTLTSAGREKALHDPESMLRAQREAAVPGVRVLGLYAVLGSYDFVNIVEADDSDAIARFSLELGVRAGAHVTTLTAIPLGRLEESSSEPERQLDEELSWPDETKA